MAHALKRKRAEIPASTKPPKMDENVDGDYDMDNAEVSEDASEASGMEEDIQEDEWDGISGPTESSGNVTHDPHTAAKANKPPTGEELRAIKDASDLFKSSSFKLQVDALLPNVRPKATRIPPLEQFLFALHSLLKEIPSVAPQHPLEAARKLLKKGIAVPYSLPLPSEDTNWKVAFEPPSDITLVGSWANKVAVKPKDGCKFGVDLAVEMPNTLFQEKDYLNGRFFHKRSFYLATIASAIQKSKEMDVEVTYESLSGDTRLTKLVLVPRNNDSPRNFTKLNAKVCIIPVLATNSPIPLHRLSPSHSNIRLHNAADSKNDEAQSSTQLPSPYYNNSILRTMTPKYQLLAMHELQKECPAFSDALTLLRVWANQRGYSEGSRMCVRGFEGAGPWWWSILALLLNGEERRPGATKANKRKSVGRGLSSYQLFKAALEFLAKHDWQNEPVFVRSAEGHRYSPEEYKVHVESVFVDSASLTNLLAGVPLGSLDLLRYDACKTLQVLNQASFSGDPFTKVFLKDCRELNTRFDVILRVNVSSAKPRSTSAHHTIDIGSPANTLLSSMDALLRQGLGDRSRAVTILHPTSAPRALSLAHPSSPDIIFIGIVHDPQHAFRLVDHGPAADSDDQSALEKFRKLWGDKSELRRFKDGRIMESVVWEVTTADERAHVPSMVVRHLLKHHFNIEEDDVEVWQTSFDSLLRLPQSVSREYTGSGISTGFKGALTAFDNLVKAIKNLDDELPLSLLTVSPISDMLRYTSVFSPVPLPITIASHLPQNARYLAPIDIVLEFEKSSRWPDDLKAVQAIKLAFFEKISTALMESVPGLVAKVVTGDYTQNSLITDKAYMEVITPEGWAFSARIWHDREVTLLDQVIGGKANALPHIVTKGEKKKSVEYYEALEAKEVYMRRFIHAPRHHRAIAALAHHYSAFPGTVRLVKRWLASHWIFHGHISDELVELICASFFVESGRTVTNTVDEEKTIRDLVPASKERGFACVVQFLKEWKWEEGLFVPLYGPDATLGTNSPSSPLKSSTSSVWKVTTELDKEGHIWTHQGPDLVVAHRIRALANATWECLQGVESAGLNVKSMFMHPTDDYDVLLQLDPSVLPRYLHNVAADSDLLTKRGKYANKTSEETVKLMPGFDPARMFFDDLQRIYEDTLKFFYDPLGGDKIGAVWDPSLRDARSFRVLGGFSSIPAEKENEKSKDKNMVNLNQSAVIAEIERLGTGIVRQITLTN